MVIEMADRRWLEDVTERYYKEIYCYCRRHVDTDDLAYELTQSVFLRLCEQYRTVDRERVRAWLYRVACHLCADYYRAEYRRREWTAPMPPELADHAPTAEEGFCAVETADAVTVLLSRLNESDQQLFDERYRQSLTYEEIAQRRNTTAAAIRKRISRMRRKLQKLAQQLLFVLILLWK